MDYGPLIQSALQSILALIGNASLDGVQISTVLNFLIGIVPVVEKEFTDLVAPVQNIIAALQNQSAATPEPLSILSALIGTSDDDYDAAFAAYKLAHP